MTKNSLFKERLRIIRKHLGVKEEDEKLVDPKETKRPQQTKVDKNVKEQNDDD